MVDYICSFFYCLSTCLAVFCLCVYVFHGVPFLCFTIFCSGVFVLLLILKHSSHSHTLNSIFMYIVFFWTSGSVPFSLLFFSGLLLLLLGLVTLLPFLQYMYTFIDRFRLFNTLVYLFCDDTHLRLPNSISYNIKMCCTLVYIHRTVYLYLCLFRSV